MDQDSGHPSVGHILGRKGPAFLHISGFKTEMGGAAEALLLPEQVNVGGEPQGPLKKDVKVLLRGRNVTLGAESLTSRMSLGWVGEAFRKWMSQV